MRFWCVLLAVSTSPAAAGVRGGRGNQGNPGVAPPFSSPGGASYGEWAARWWQWALETPASEHPFVLGDCDASINDDIDVRFLPPNFAGTPIEYRCIVSSGKALFFPILNLGMHEIDVSGSATCPFGDFAVSVTYRVTVVPGE